ncbi:MAG: trxA [Rickettsiaceae bacterium]|jgi:thioredoxin 1|nr:trxA [Rickettsiaceae bacterium]
MVLEVTDSSFEQEVLNSDTPVLVDFWAAWCGPCKMLEPIIKEVAEELKGKIKVAKMNVDDNPNMPSQFGIRGIPTMILFKDGKQMDVKVGVLQKQAILDWLGLVK